MTTIVLLLHLLIAIGLVALVLMQRSEGGGLGMGSGSGGFMTGRGTANMLTRATAGLAAAFFATSITLTLLARQSVAPVSPLDQPAATKSTAPVGSTPAVPPASGGAPAGTGGVLESLEKGKSPLPQVPKSQ